MPIRTSAARGLEISTEHISEPDIIHNIAPGTVLSSLSSASRIDLPGYYWISVKSSEAVQKVVKHKSGKSYTGYTFEGVPQITGYYIDNHDGTFTKLSNPEDSNWHDRVYVSEQAASEARSGRRPLILEVNMTSHERPARLCVISSENESYHARVTYVRDRSGNSEELRINNDLMAKVRSRIDIAEESVSTLEDVVHQELTSPIREMIQATKDLLRELQR